MAALASKGDLYETELLEQFDDGEAAKEFFRCLDVQLNKVNQFYRMKEKEFSERGESLKRQMEILIELKNALNQQHTKEEDDDESSSGTVLCGTELNYILCYVVFFMFRAVCDDPQLLLTKFIP